MNRPSEKEIARRLSSVEAPEPPADLLARILEDIPEQLPAAANDDGPPPAAPFHRRRQLWVLAATVVVMIGGGWLAWQVRQQQEPPGQAAFETVSSPDEPRASEADRFEALTRQLPEGGEQAAAQPAPTISEGRADDAMADLRSRLREQNTPGPSERPADEEAAGTTSARDAEYRRLLKEADWLSRAPAAPPAPPAPAPQAAKPRSQRIPKPAPETDQAEALMVRSEEHAMVGRSGIAPPSTGGTAEPNDRPYGDVFFDAAGTNPFIDTEDDRLSTFALDVDTGSYTVARRYLRDGNLPDPASVRVEEFVNAFDYGDEPPSRGDFALYAEGAPSPFAEGGGETSRYRLLRFALAAREVDAGQRPAATLIFVVDVSGSMDQENRLGLVRQSLNLLVDQLRSDDRVGLVVFGSSGHVLLEPTGDREQLRRAIDRLVPEGSTNAEEGLLLAYELAGRHLRPGAINRLILCSDGVANVGATGPDSILERIGREARRGIELTTLGFGMGNYNDVLMEQLADRGNGNYAYVDTLDEARRVLVENLTGTLLTVAGDAKVQVEFNPEVVERYRLLGYENRDVADRDFRNDAVDAGEIGAGHRVTALYEVKLAGGVRGRQEIATLRLRYLSKRTGQVVEEARSLGTQDLAERWNRASPALRLASLVAETAEILKGSYWAREGDLGEVLRRLQQLAPEFAGDPDVAEFTAMVAQAARLQAAARAGSPQ